MRANVAGGVPAGHPALRNARARQRVVEYYTHCGDDYRILWRVDTNGTIHYGLSEDAPRAAARDAARLVVEVPVAIGAAALAGLVGLLPRRVRGDVPVRCLRVAARGRAARHDRAQVRMTAACAAAVPIRPGDRVLDAGCGVGGVAVWLASMLGARVHGVNVQPEQLAVARVRARGLADCVSFAAQDYTQLGLRADAFDVVWGLESVCHCEEKRDFLAEAYRVLRPGGRLMVADFFQTHERPTPEWQPRMRAWLDGWAIPNLASVQGFGRALEELGFCEVAYRDVRRQVLPSARRLYKASLVAYPIGLLLERIGVRTPPQTSNIRAAYYQYVTLRRAVWTYGIFTATKPGGVSPRAPAPPSAAED